jgi:hypothetical protein
MAHSFQPFFSESHAIRSAWVPSEPFEGIQSARAFPEMMKLLAVPPTKGIFFVFWLLERRRLCRILSLRRKLDLSAVYALLGLCFSLVKEQSFREEAEQKRLLLTMIMTKWCSVRLWPLIKIWYFDQLMRPSLKYLRPISFWAYLGELERTI